MSEVKVNKISPRSGTTVTLGDSGDTFTIPSGATINNQGTATNFGATGAASWTTTVKTGDFTAVAGEGYFVNTTSGEIDVALPAGSAGAVVAVKDYAGTFDTNNCILVPNGSDKIGGVALNATLSTEGIAVTLVFIDSTQGWLVTDDGVQSSADNNPFMAATGGTITTSGNDTIHTFTGPGTFCVSKVANCAANNLVSYMVVAGGGGTAGATAGQSGSGGAGAGGFREVKSPVTPYTASPLDGYATPGNRITVTAGPTSYPVDVGGGGPQPATDIPSCQCGNAMGAKGSTSHFSTIVAGGGGGGAGQTNACSAIQNGGSGGGADYTCGNQGVGNTPSVTPPQGTPGGNTGTNGPPYTTGGGGGATVTGATSTPTIPGAGGAGATSSITGSGITRAGGGGGGGSTHASPGAGQPGGTGGGANGGSVAGQRSDAGQANTGGGGGGGYGNPGMGGAGGSGVVIIRYKFQ